MALVGEDAGCAAGGGAGDGEVDGGLGGVVYGEAVADRGVFGLGAGGGEGEGQGGGFGQVGAACADAREDRFAGEGVGEDDGLGEADDVRVAVGVAVAHGREEAAPALRVRHQRVVPFGDGHLVVQGEGAVPDLDRVGLLVGELPVAADAGGVRMGRDDQAARAADAAGETGKASSRAR